MSGGTQRIYFDHNASAPLHPLAREALLDALVTAGNPSSVHREGRRIRAIVEEARRSVAALCGGAADNVVFTSGATEAANMALSPRWTRAGVPVVLRHLAVAATDHPCLTAGGRFDAASVTALPVDHVGHLRIDSLRAWLAAVGEEPAMLAITLANNESGVIQPVEPIREALGGRDVLFVVDAVQAGGRMPLSIEALGADALILSGHKLGAMPGVGSLVLGRADCAPEALLRGGSQERRLRAGTEATAAIASFGAAARVASERTERERTNMLALRGRLETRLRAAGDVVIVGDGAERLPNTVFVAAEGLAAETAQIALDLRGIAVSGGSACGSGKVAGSPVLAAHAAAGLSIALGRGALRLSFGFDADEAEIDSVADALAELIGRAQKREQKAA